MKKYSNLEDLNFLSESALESSLAGFWDWNIETNEEYLSPRFKEMFGYSDDEKENSPELVCQPKKIRQAYFKAMFLFLQVQLFGHTVIILGIL